MIDTANKRAAALGFGLSFLLVLPQASGALTIETAGHALNAYEYDLPAQEAADGDIIVAPAMPRILVVPAELPIMVTKTAETIIVPRRMRP